jgi:hypothetical protein
MGQSRLDCFAWPVATLAVCLGAARMIEHVPVVSRLQRVGIVSGGACLALFLYTARQQLQCPAQYVASSERQIVHAVHDLVADGTPLVVYPWANWALGYYGDWPVELVPAPETAAHFYAVSQRPRTLVLREAYDGRNFLEHHEVITSALRPFVAAAGPRIVYFGAGRPGDLGLVPAALGSFGFREIHRESGSLAVAIVLDRSAPNQRSSSATVLPLTVAAGRPAGSMPGRWSTCAARSANATLERWGLACVQRRRRGRTSRGRRGDPTRRAISRAVGRSRADDEPILGAGFSRSRDARRGRARHARG